MLEDLVVLAHMNNWKHMPKQLNHERDQAYFLGTKSLCIIYDSVLDKILLRTFNDDNTPKAWAINSEKCFIRVINHDKKNITQIYMLGYSKFSSDRHNNQYSGYGLNPSLATLLIDTLGASKVITDDYNP